MKKLLIPSLLLGAFAVSASAQTDVIKANNTTSLNNGGSWVLGNVPGTSDIATWDSTVTANNTVSLGGNLTFGGLKITNTGGTLVTIATGNFLTLNSGGINMSSSNANLTVNSGLILGGNQTWNIGTGRTIQVATNSSLNNNGNTLTVSGSGVLDWRSSVSGSIGGVISVGTVGVNAASANLTLTNSSNSFTTFNIFNGRANVSSIGNFGQTSAAGTGGTSTNIVLGSSNASSVFGYTGGSASSNRTFNMDRRSNGNSILVTEAATTLTLSGNISTAQGNDTGAKNVALTVGGAGNLVISGVITNHVTSGNVTSVIKNDGGSLTLSGNNTFAGGVTVNAGTLLVNNTVGSGTGSGAVVIESGATLGGTGTINGITTINGILAPGNSIGTLNVNNTVTWNDNDAWTFELGTAGVSMLSSGTSDLLNITGSFTKGTGSSFTFDFLGTGEQGWYKLADWTVGTTFVAGDFAATNLASGLSGEFTVDSGTSALYLQVVPEPSTWALIAVAGTVLVAVRRRQRLG